jgi:protein involved in polysaccharide export with SLBB domain
MQKFLVLFLMAVSSGAGSLAQQPSQSPYPDGSQNPTPGTQVPGTLDCSDPSEFGNPGCASQNSGAYQTQNPQLRTPQTDRFGNQTARPNGNYSDTEQLNRQQSQNGQIQERRPLAPLTEFQKFVASTTGQVLPIYGSNLFERVPSTFAPVDMTPVPPDFVIGPGDELRIRVWGQLSFQANVRVDRSGDIYLPQVGPIHVASVPFSELDGHLRSAIGRVFHNFDLTVDLGQIRSIQIYLAGEARTPGVYTVSSLSTMVDALFAGGGPNMQGSFRNIELRRGSQVMTHFDLYDLLVRGYNSSDAKLLPGDVIYIPPVGPQVAMTGSVKSPAIYELLPGETLSAALYHAGGISAVASAARISIERIEDHNERQAMEIAYDKSGLETPLADGDIVRIFSIVPRYSKTVILRGNIANPGRFAWHAGMRLSDLIPDKDSLVTRDYWWKRTQLGLPAPEFEPIPGFQNLRQPYDGNVVTLKPPPQDEPNSQNDTRNSMQQQEPSLDRQNPPDRSAPLDDRSGQSTDRNLSAQQRASSSSLGAQQYSSSPQEMRSARRTTVRLLAPDIDWDYATVERIDPDTLKTTLVPFDLGSLVLKHDATQDLELKSGDIVSIFSEADIHVPLAEQTKLVTLDGEFVHSGIYSARPDETLKELVERAGGISPKAYLYGSEFTRESVRAMQQARINEYVQTLQMRIQRSNLALVSSSTSTPQDIASGTAAQSSERDLISALRQIRATGRVVLTLKPDSTGTGSLPDMTMENGDRFVIPSVPAVVNVIGSVYNQNSFLYVKGRRVGAYLLQAGGPNRDADRKHAFIIRANGDVISRDAGKSIWVDEFAKLRLNPGDTIVVPEKTFRPSALRGVLDWSQVFSQFALGAAAINVIR